MFKYIVLELCEINLNEVSNLKHSTHSFLLYKVHMLVLSMQVSKLRREGSRDIRLLHNGNNLQHTLSPCLLQSENEHGEIWLWLPFEY